MTGNRMPSDELAAVYAYWSASTIDAARAGVVDERQRLGARAPAARDCRPSGERSARGSRVISPTRIVSVTASSSAVPSLRMCDAYTPPSLPATRASSMISHGLCIGAWDVLQAGREPHRAIGHARQTSDFIRLSSAMVGSRLAVPITSRRTVLWPMSVAKLTDAPRSFDIAASALPTSSAERAAVAGDDGRDAHADEVLGAGMVGKIVGVGVDVDEAWRDDEPGRVDALARVALRDRADGRDASVLDGDVGAPRRRAGAIDDLAAGDHEVVPLACLCAKPKPGRRAWRPDGHTDRERTDAREIAWRGHDLSDDGHHATSLVCFRGRFRSTASGARALRDVARPGLSR